MFDPDDYLDPRNVGARPKRAARVVKEETRTLYRVPAGQDWHVVATLAGSLPEAHLRRSNGDFGSIITACDRVGRSVHVIEPDTRAYLCEDCQRAVWGKR